MRRTASLVGLAVSILVLVGLSVSAYRKLDQRSAREAAYTTEQEWIVYQTIRGIVETSRFAANENVAGALDLKVTTEDSPEANLLNAATYELTTSIPRIPRRLAIVDHVWAAETYLPVAQPLFPRVEASGDAEPDDSVVAMLTNPTVDALIDASNRVRQISRRVRCPRSR